MAGTNEAWNEVGERFATWGRRVAERYKEASGAAGRSTRESQSTLEDTARDVTDALDRAFTALGDTIRDDDAKQDLKEAVRALGDAISVTVSDTSDQIRRRVGSTSSSPEDAPEGEEPSSTDKV